jgi:hypothetical protein
MICTERWDIVDIQMILVAKSHPMLCPLHRPPVDQLPPHQHQQQNK